MIQASTMITPPARKGEKSVGTLAGIVAFARQTDLHLGKAEHDHTNASHKPEHKVRQIVDRLNGIVCLRKDRNGQNTNEQNCHQCHHPQLHSFLFHVLHSPINFSDN